MASQTKLFTPGRSASSSKERATNNKSPEKKKLKIKLGLQDAVPAKDHGVAVTLGFPRGSDDPKQTPGFVKETKQIILKGKDPEEGQPVRKINAIGEGQEEQHASQDQDQEPQKLPFECKLCSKPFQTQWELNKHSETCRKPGSKYVRAGSANLYKCSICKESCRDRDLFNLHVFESHSSIDVYAKYQRSLEELITKPKMERLRSHVFNQIFLGQWEQYLARISHQPDHDDYKNIKYTCALDADDDALNVGLRLLRYNCERDMLLKLAEETKADRVLKQGKEQLRQQGEAEQEYIFDLRKNAKNDFLPITVVDYLQASLLATRKKVSCLPHLIQFSRAHSEVTLKLSTLPVCFKDVVKQESVI